MECCNKIVCKNTADCTKANIKGICLPLAISSSCYKSKEWRYNKSERYRAQLAYETGWRIVKKEMVTASLFCHPQARIVAVKTGREAII